jgi:hypothetical protein
VSAAEEAARRIAAANVLAATRAEDNALVAVAEMSRAAREVMRAELPAERLDDFDRFLAAYAAPDGPAVTAYLEGLHDAFTTFCIAHLTLEELHDFARFQHSARFKSLSPQLATAVKEPLRVYQTTLVQQINACFRAS